MTDDAIITGILDREGGFVNDARDPGGATNWGITRNTLREWRGVPVTVDDVRQLTEAEAREIYRARYLRPFDGIDPQWKAQVVDIAVNSGVTTARALFAMAQQQTARSVGNQLAIERLKHYARICKNKPTSCVFLPGWINRATSFLV